MLNAGQGEGMISEEGEIQFVRASAWIFFVRGSMSLLVPMIQTGDFE